MKLDWDCRETQRRIVPVTALMLHTDQTFSADSSDKSCFCSGTSSTQRPLTLQSNVHRAPPVVLRHRSHRLHGNRVKETLSNCADAGSRLQPTCFWFQRRSSNRYWLLFSAFITHNPSETATSSETQRKKATYILKPPDRRTVIHERHQSNAAFSITNMTSEQSFPEEAHEKHSSELLNTAVSSVHLTDKCCQNREKKNWKKMLKNRNKWKVFHNSSKVTLGVNTIIFSYSFSFKKNVNSSVSQTCTYTRHKLAFKLVT